MSFTLNRGFWSPPTSNLLPLDAVSGATLAFSVRKLRAGYAGSAIRVRRSSDNTEQDIGFSGNDLDSSGLLSFAGAGDAFVVKWYDQSGAGSGSRIAYQATTSKQAKIVSSGSLITAAGSKASLDCDGTDDGYVVQNDDGSGVTIGNIITASAYTIFALFRPDAISASAGEGYTFPAVWNDMSRYIGLHLHDTNKLKLYNWDGNADYATISGVAANANHLFEGRHESGSIYAKVDDIAEVSVASGNTQSLGGSFRIADNAVFFDGKISEILAFDSALSSGDRSTLRSSANTYFSLGLT